MKYESTCQCSAVIKRFKWCFKSIIISTLNKSLNWYTHNIFKYLILQIKIIFKLRVYFIFFLLDRRYRKTNQNDKYAYVNKLLEKSIFKCSFLGITMQKKYIRFMLLEIYLSGLTKKMFKLFSKGKNEKK